MARLLLAGAEGRLTTEQARAIAIGNFDGVHLGRRSVVRSILGLGMTSTVLTFDPHPRAFFGREVRELSTLEQRIGLLERTGVDEIVVLPFDGAMAALTPDAWMHRYLEPIGARIVAVGEDFRFGRNRSGDVALLRRMGLDVRPVPLIPGVSSTRVRELVRLGRLAGAARLLGRVHELDVTVVDVARRRGATDLELQPASPSPALPPSGTYAAHVGSRRGTVELHERRTSLRAVLTAWDGRPGDRVAVGLAAA